MGLDDKLELRMGLELLGQLVELVYTKNYTKMGHGYLGHAHTKKRAHSMCMCRMQDASMLTMKGDCQFDRYADV